MFIRIPAAFAAASLALLSLAGCNTVDGLGQDVSAAGSGVSNAANTTEEKIEEATE